MRYTRDAGYCGVCAVGYIASGHLDISANDQHHYGEYRTRYVYKVSRFSQFAFRQRKKLFEYRGDKKTSAAESEEENADDKT